MGIAKIIDRLNIEKCDLVSYQKWCPKIFPHLQYLYRKEVSLKKSTIDNLETWCLWLMSSAFFLGVMVGKQTERARKHQ